VWRPAVASGSGCIGLGDSLGRLHPAVGCGLGRLRPAAIVAATATDGGCRRTIVAGSAPVAGADVDGDGRRLVLLRRCGWAGVVMVVTPGGGLGLFQSFVFFGAKMNLLGFSKDKIFFK
jgi:hypothetical protein